MHAHSCVASFVFQIFSEFTRMTEVDIEKAYGDVVDKHYGTLDKLTCQKQRPAPLTNLMEKCVEAPTAEKKGSTWVLWVICRQLH